MNTTVVKIDIDGEQHEYRLTNARPSMILGLENGETFHGETPEQTAARRACELLDSAFSQLDALPSARRCTLLSSYGLTEAASTA